MRGGVGAAVAGLVLLLLSGCGTAPAPTASTAVRQRAAVVAPAPTPTGPAHSLDDPRSIWIVVDKARPLQPADWVPADLVTAAVPHTAPAVLRRPAARALERLVARAHADGIGLVSLSPYRSFASQQAIYTRNVRRLGRAETERLTARPGYSEHQTGLAVDLGDASGRCRIQRCFGSTAAGRWLAAEAWRSGWVLRYPEGARHVTGIQWEPWHYRYVGTALARELRDSGTPTLEQWFGLPAAPHHR